MLILKARPRKIKGKKTRQLRETGSLPAILYGPEIKPMDLEVGARDLDKAYLEAGESTLLELEVEGHKDKALVLIYDVQKDSVSSSITHVDFFQPNLKEKIEAHVPIIIENEAPAVKDLGGTLIKNIQEVKVRALPQDLPKAIVADARRLVGFGEAIRIKDLLIKEGVEIMQDAEDIVAQIMEPEKVEEELAKPVEEKVEEVEKVEKLKKEEELPPSPEENV